jgi:hypothetical protein
MASNDAGPNRLFPGDGAMDGANYSVFGSLLSPGGGHVLWITSYDELFTIRPTCSPRLIGGGPACWPS